MSENRIQRVEQDLSGTDLAPRLGAAIAFARNQSRVGPVAARAARQALREAGLSDEEMKEIAFVVASADFLNRLHTIPAIPSRSMERMPELPFMRLFRPLINRILKKHQYRGQATARPNLPDFPYARLVAAYAGSPIAAALAQLIEAMSASPHLTRRCKLLMLAVVARGLGCAPCADEIGAALRGEGLSEGALGEVLTHLDASELDPLERLLVPFARETIWYEPIALQRRARALRDRLSGMQFLEAIGVASLANGLCRMNAVVMDAR